LSTRTAIPLSFPTVSTFLISSFPRIAWKLFVVRFSPARPTLSSLAIVGHFCPVVKLLRMRRRVAIGERKEAEIAANRAADARFR
jgi:hypothetical protein